MFVEGEGQGLLSSGIRYLSLWRCTDGVKDQRDYWYYLDI